MLPGPGIHPTTSLPERTKIVTGGRLPAMSQRHLYLAAYDVADPGRLRQALKILRGYASGGQKSVFECFLSDAEKFQLLAQMGDLLDLEEDRFVLVRLDPRAKVRTLGIGIAPNDAAFIYIE